jgi:hypothetical protein
MVALLAGGQRGDDQRADGGGEVTPSSMAEFAVN